MNLKRILKLINNQEKAVILDENGEPKAVLIRIEEYERLKGGGDKDNVLTNDHFLDRINRDVENLNSNDNVDFLPNFEEKEAYPEENGTDIVNLEENEEDRYYFEPVE